MSVPSEKLGLEVVIQDLLPHPHPLAIDVPVMNIDLNSESLKIKIRPIYV